MGSLKDKLFHIVVDKNEYIKNDYYTYVESNIEEHKRKRLVHWMVLCRLNVRYRIFRKNGYIYYRPNAGSSNRKNNRPEPWVSVNQPESILFNKTPSIKLAISMIGYDVISFDIFDTLIFRPFAKPSDLFYVIGKRLDMPEFHSARIDAEKQARENMYALEGTYEITLNDIYSILEEVTGLDAKRGMDCEIRTELDYCIPNLYMQEIYNLLKDNGKELVLCSDMYLPKQVIEEMLVKCGYSGYERLYLSNEYGCSKKYGGLYDYLIRDHGEKKIIHIGDNPKYDVEMANKKGIRSIHYFNVNEAGKKYRTTGMTELVGSAYAGLSNIHLHSGHRNYSQFYEYGYLFGGIYVLGYCSWMYRKVLKEGIEKIIFLSRDGEIYKRVMDYLYPEIKTEYFLWSRVASARYMIWNKGIRAYTTAIVARCNSPENITLGDFLSSYGISELERFLKGNRYISVNTIISNETKTRVVHFLRDHVKDIEGIYETQMKQLESVVRKKVGEAKKVAVVDVGWLGSGPAALRHLIKDKFKMDCFVSCWVAGATSSSQENISADCMDDTVEAYLFSNNHNRDSYHSHISTNTTSKNRLNNAFFELFTQAHYPTFNYYGDDGTFNFGIPEVENYSVIKDIHNGIFDFAVQYSRTFKNDSYMLNISGYDAYRPFKLCARDKNYYKKIFGDFAFPQIIGNTSNRETIETIETLINVR